MHTKRILAGIFLFLMSLASSRCLASWNSVYQFGVELPKSETDPLIWNKTPAFLWVPPESHHLRAIILAPANVIERQFCDDPIIRSEAEKDDLAILFFQAGWKGDFTTRPQLVEYVQSMLDALAERSGYAELKTIPWIPIGHSGNSAFTAGISRQASSRTLANITIKGGLINPTKDGNTAGLVGIPTLFMNGEYEEVMPPGKVRNAWWGEAMKRFHIARAAVPEALFSGMEDRGNGHLNWFPELSTYTAMFVHKAIAARLPDGDSAKMTDLAFSSGWLGDPTGVNPIAQVKNYKGDRKDAFWFFDEEQAKAWKSLFFRGDGKKEQILAFTQDDKIADWWSGWGLQKLDYRPEEDGVTFMVNAVWRNEVAPPFSDAGLKLGHSVNGEIKYCVLGWAGATEQVGPNKFRYHLDREGVNGRTLHLLIGCYHPGDAEYRNTIAVGSMDVTNNVKDAQPQKLTFPQIADQAAGTASVPLSATADSNKAADYFVSYGPASIDGSTLHFTDIPAQAKFPIEVKVSAYCWWRYVDPKLSPAIVTQTFHLLASAK